MTAVRLLMITLLLILGCEEEGSIDQCVISEAIVSYPDPQGGREQTEKYVYFHDGVNYTEIRAHLSRDNEGSFLAEPNFIMKLTYNLGRIAEVLYISTAASDTYTEHTYTYQEPGVIVQVTNVVNGQVQSKTSSSTLFVPSPGDETCLFVNSDQVNVLAVFEMGNLTKLGFEDTAGTHEAYDTTWTFFITYGYDRLPNSARDFAYQYHLGSPNMGYCTNNMTETRLHGSPDFTIVHRNSYTLLRKWLKTWTYESTGRSISFSYTCR